MLFRLAFSFRKSTIYDIVRDTADADRLIFHAVLPWRPAQFLEVARRDSRHRFRTTLFASLLQYRH